MGVQKEIEIEGGKVKLKLTDILPIINRFSIHVEPMIRQYIHSLKQEIGIRLRIFVRNVGRLTTVGGSATESFTILGVTESMECFPQILEEGAAPVTIKKSKCEKNKITVVFSADPSNDHKIKYVVI